MRAQVGLVFHKYQLVHAFLEMTVFSDQFIPTDLLHPLYPFLRHVIEFS